MGKRVNVKQKNVSPINGKQGVTVLENFTGGEFGNQASGEGKYRHVGLKLNFFALLRGDEQDESIKHLMQLESKGYHIVSVQWGNGAYVNCLLVAKVADESK